MGGNVVGGIVGDDQQALGQGRNSREDRIGCASRRLVATNTGINVTGAGTTLNITAGVSVDTTADNVNTVNVTTIVNADRCEIAQRPGQLVGTHRTVGRVLGQQL